MFRARSLYDISAHSGRMSPYSYAAALTAERALAGLLSVAARISAEAGEALRAWLATGADYLSGLVRVMDGRALALPGIGGMPEAELSFRADRVKSDEVRDAVQRIARVRAPGGGPEAEVLDVSGTLVIRFAEVPKTDSPPRVFMLLTETPEMSEMLPVTWDERIEMWVAKSPKPRADFSLAVVPAEV
jgi:hypothetical protein